MPPQRVTPEQLRLPQLETLYGLPPGILPSVMQQESGGNPNAVSPAGAVGAFQFLPSTAQELGVNPRDPQQAAVGAAQYYRQLIDRYSGNIDRALAAYNWGMGNVERRGMANAPAETRNYITQVKSGMAATTAIDDAEQAIYGGKAPAAPQTQPATGKAWDVDSAEEAIYGKPQARATGAPPPTPGVERVTIDVEKQPPEQPAGVDITKTPEYGEVQRFFDVPLRPGPAEKKQAAATAISTATSLGGAALGGYMAGPAGVLPGEMVGAGVGREINKKLGLEDPGTLGDVLAVGGPLMSRGIGGAVRYGGRVLQGRTPPAAQEVIDTAARYDVPVGYADMPGATTARSAATALEKVPVVGTAGFRTTQQQQVKKAATTVAEATREAMKQTPYKDLASAQVAAQQGDKAAQRVVEEIANAGEDWTKVVQASGNLRAWRARQAAGTLYDRVEALAQGMGDLPLTQTKKSLDDAITELSQAKIPDASTLRLLTDLRAQLDTGNAFPIIRQLRSDIGDLVRDYYKGTNAVVGAKGVGILQKVKGAVEQDMADFATQGNNPALKTAWERADRFYREQVIPYKDAGIAKALSTDTPDEVYRQFVQRGKGDRAEKFYKALDQKGQAAVRSGMVQEALEKATQETTGVFSPAKFAKSLEDVKEAYGVFFRGHEKWEMDGFTKLMRHTERAGQYAENPPTGQRLIPFLLGGGAVGGALTAPLTTVAGVGALKGTSWLLTSPAGRRLLLAASDSTPGSPAMRRVVETILREGTRVASQEEPVPAGGQ